MLVVALAGCFAFGLVGAVLMGNATGVAIGVGIASAAMALVVVLRALVGTGSTLRRAFVELGELILPSLVLVSLCAGAIYQAPEEPMDMLVWTGGAAVLVLLVGGIMFGWVWRRTLGGSS